MDEYRSPADYARNSGDCHTADEQAEFYAWAEACDAQEYLNNHSTTTN